MTTLISGATSALPLAMSAPLLTAALFVALPLAAAYWLILRAARRQPAVPVPLSGNVLGSLRAELVGNHDQLRRTGEALTLSTDAWRRLGGRIDLLPAPAREPLQRTYHAIAVANRLLGASAAYDSRGQLSLRQRRLALWPTLEAAVRSGLQALGVTAEPARQARIRVADDAPAADRRTLAPRPHGSAAPRRFTLTQAPRLALFCDGAESPAQPQTSRRKRAAARLQRRCDGQMGLWESVA